MTIISAKVVLDSINDFGNRLITMELEYPRFIHSELMTHRDFSRSASSSRAIPIAKMLEQVRTNPAMPIHWGKNQPGMQANEQVEDTMEAKQQWMMAARMASDVAERMAAIGLHKQVGNRILEPFMHIKVIVTATEWANFFELRDHPDAEPHIQMLAQRMRYAQDRSAPKHLKALKWHMPYVSDEEVLKYGINNCLYASTARCARVSYMNHDGTAPDIAKDIELHDRLVGSTPIHASPAEHVAQSQVTPSRNKNFVGWTQYRSFVEYELARKKRQSA